jgi:hypothetical protein
MGRGEDSGTVRSMPGPRHRQAPDDLAGPVRSRTPPDLSRTHGQHPRQSRWPRCAEKPASFQNHFASHADMGIVDDITTHPFGFMLLDAGVDQSETIPASTSSYHYLLRA